MTNDLTTIEGCLQEAIDRLEANLLAKGVNASYSASDGYFDLLDEILNISTSSGSNCSQYTEQIEDAIETINGLPKTDYTFQFNTIYQDGTSAIDICDNMTGTVDGKTVAFTKGSNGFSVTAPFTSISTYSFTLTYDDTNYNASNGSNGVVSYTGQRPVSNPTVIIVIFVAKGGGLIEIE